jgi:hypothetical protein
MLTPVISLTAATATAFADSTATSASTSPQAVSEQAKANTHHVRLRRDTLGEPARRVPTNPVPATWAIGDRGTSGSHCGHVATTLVTPADETCSRARVNLRREIFRVHVHATEQYRIAAHCRFLARACRRTFASGFVPIGIPRLFSRRHARGFRAQPTLRRRCSACAPDLNWRVERSSR